MMVRCLAALAAAALVLAAPASATAQDGHGASAADGAERLITAEQLGADVPKEGGAADIIMPHITDAPHMELPWPLPPFYKEVHLPHWHPIHIGPLTLDLSPTKHVVMLFVAAILCAATLSTAAQAHKRHHHAVGRPRGFAAGIESMVLYIRNEVILPNVGHHGEGYVPFLLTMFFFILFANVLGLIPYGATATGNIAVTATLALISFVTIELAGMRTLGKGYINTIVFWPHDMALPMKLGLTLVLTPVELIGKFTKPFALAIRLFANMTAGHVIVLALIGIIFTFESWIVAPFPFVMALAIMLLEVLVAFIQAYIFTMLTAVFIGQIRESHH